MDQLIGLRTQLLDAKGCSFLAEVTADYGDEIYIFTLNCNVDEQGSLAFTVEDPQTISGITGTVDASGGKLTFNDDAVLFETLCDGLITPVSAPWVMISALRGGYIIATGEEDEHIIATIRDTYKEQALEADFIFSNDCVPVRCEMLWQGKRILSMNVEKFVIL